MTSPREMVSPVFAAEDRDHLRGLRRSDPQANLEERWEKITAARPDLASGRLGYVPKIIEEGWAVVGIPDEGFAYTIGLHYRYGQPELLLAAPHLSSAEIQQLLNAIGKHVALRLDAQRPHIAAGEPVDLEDWGVSITFEPYSQNVFEKEYATGYLATFERMFEDRDHETGDTLPVLWAKLPESVKPVPKAPAPKAEEKKRAPPEKAAKKAAATKKTPTKKAAAKKAATKKAAKKTSGRPAPSKKTAKGAKTSAKKTATRAVTAKKAKKKTRAR